MSKKTLGFAVLAASLGLSVSADVVYKSMILRPAI